MLLEQLRPNLCELPREEAFILFIEYYHKRSEEIQAVRYDIPKPKKKKAVSKKKKEKAVSFSPSQIEALKQLGLI